MVATSMFGSTGDDFRKKLAEMMAVGAFDTSPIKSEWQGASRLAQALMLGLEGADQDRKRKEARTALMALPGLSDAPTAMTPPAATPAPQTGALPPPPPTNVAGTGVPVGAGKIYDWNEPNPMDPPSPKDRDMAVRTILAEAGNQGPTGQAAVANVIRNRSVAGTYGGDTVGGVVTAPKQFEPWNTAGGRANMAAIDPNSPAYQQAGALLDQAYGGASDPTGGATHFYAPKAQAALGRQPPAWDNGTGQMIGDHRFFNLGPGGAGANPQVSSSPPAGPAPAVPPAAGGNVRQTVDIPPQMKAIIRSYINSDNPELAQYGLQLYQQYAGPQQYDFKVAGDTLYRTSGRTGSAEAVGQAAKASYGVIGKDPTSGQDVYGWTNPADRSVTQGPQVGAPQTGPLAIPPAPPGVDPTLWRKQQTERLAQNTMPGSSEEAGKLRGEVRALPSFKNFNEAAPIYKNMLATAGTNSRASDLNLVYSLGKIFDPGSVVREGEMVMVRNTASLPDWLMGTINSLNGGAALTPETRQAIMAEAHNRMQAYQSLYEQDLQQYRGIVERNRLNAADVIPELGQIEQYKPATPTPSPAPKSGAAPPPAAVQMLRSNPALREQFEKKYGAGSAARALGEGA